MIRASLIRLSPILALAAVLAALFVLAGPPLGATPVAAGSDSCVTTDTDLVSQVEAKVERHTKETGREDLKEMFSRSLATMKGTDTYTTADIKARPDKQGDNWQGPGPNPLWQKIYSELDRLETCRGAQSDDNTPATPAVSVAAGSGITEGGAATFTISASPAPATDLAVSLTVSQSGDYAASGSTGTKSITIPTTGSTTYSVTTVDDSTDEADGSVTVTVSSGNAYTVGTSASATVNVADNDVPAVSITAGHGITEGGNASFTLTANPVPHAPLAVSIQVSQSGDYANNGTTGTKSVTVPTAGNATYSVATVDDTADEADGSITIAVGNGNGYTVGSSPTASVSVADNDDPPAVLPTVSIAAGSGVTEGGSATFTVTASPAPTSPLTVSITVAQNGDYAASGTTGTKSATIPTSGSLTYSVATVDDNTDEANGSITVNLSAGQGYTVGTASSASVSVADNDEQPSTDQTAPNLDAPAPTENTVSVLPNGDILFGWPTTPGKPNYMVRAMSFDGHGQRTEYKYDKQWYVFDDLQQGKWLFMVYDMNVQKSVGLWIRFDVPERPAQPVPQQSDPVPTPSVSIAAGSGVTEGGNASFTITASPAPTSPLSVTLSVNQSGDYVAGSDTGTKTVTISTSGSETYSVTTVDDAVDEADGSVTITVGNGDSYTVGSSSSASVSVSDNDVPAVSIAAGSDVTEGNNATFTVSANPAPHAALTVTLSVSQSGDYAASGSTGTKSVTVPTTGNATYSVATVDDAVDEPDGSVSVAVSNGDGYSVGTPSTATVNVSDNDDPVPTPTPTPTPNPTIPTVSISGGQAVIEGNAASFTLTANPAPAAPITVSISVTQNGDYAVSGATGTKSVSMPVSGSATYSVATVDDTTDEVDGSITITVSNGNGYSVGAPSSATVSVADNDASWWTPLLSAAEPPEHAVSLLTPKGNDVLFGWPTKEDYTHYNIRARHMSGQVADDVRERAIDVANYEGNWWVFTDLNPGRWLVEVRDSSGWAHGGNFYITVPADGEPGGGILYEVTIDATDSAKHGVAEGEGATFILRAKPAPETPLEVRVSIGQSGDYAEAGSTGTKTVTIPARGFAFHRVNTVDDKVKEQGGRITATLVKNPEAYVVTALGQGAFIDVSDNDTPTVSVSAGPGTIEGGSVSFTFTVSKATLSSPLPVRIDVGQSGYFGAQGITGFKTVNIPVSGSLTYTVATVDDGRDEADGYIIVVVNDGDEYDLSTTASVAQAAVHDNDPAGAGPTCVTTDNDLLTRVSQAQDANSRNSQLNLMLGRAYNTMKGNDNYTTVNIKREKSGEADWQGNGKDALWQAIYAELDRLEVCRGPQVVQIVDNSPSTSQLNSGQSGTITSAAHIRDHDNDSSTPNGIVEGEGACFTVTLNPVPSSDQLVKFSVYEGLASDSGIEISRSGGWDYIAYGWTGVQNHGIPTSGTRTICIPTVNDRTDEKDAQIWMQISDDVGGTGWHRINVYDDDEPAPAADANLNDNDPTNDVYGPKRIPWAYGWTHATHTGKRAMPGPEGNKFGMSMYWGIPEYYRQADVRAGKDRAGEGRYKGWWGPHVTYCIQILKAEQGWNYDRPGNIPNIEMTVVGEGPINGVRCIDNMWSTDARATDKWDNGGSGESWYVASGGATYTFGIWVQGDKANTYREFKHTVRNPGGCVNVHSDLSRAFRSEYVCDYGNPDKP